MHENENMNTEGQDLTRGSIPKELWSLAWPMMLSFFFYTLYNIVDAYWVSKLSPEAIAAVSISQITLFIMMALGFGITVGSGVLMAMNIGAKNMQEAGRTLGQSFVLSALLGVFFTVIALMFRDVFLTASGATGDIFAPALEYFTIIAGGSTLTFLLLAIMFAFNSQGDTHTLTKLFAVSTLINGILDPIMIFGWMGIPAMGIAGAAWATLISQAIFIVISIWVLSSPRWQVPFRFSNLRVKWESVKKVLDIGFPAALTQVVFPLGIAALTYIVSLAYLEAGAIAFSLGFRVEFFAFLPAVGFGFAAMAMMGQSIGAGNLERAREVFNHALRYAFAGAVAMGIIAAIGAPALIGVFTNDPTVSEYTALYLWSVTFSYGFLAMLMVEAMAFQAVGRSWPGFWLFVLRVAVLTLPLAAFAALVLHLSILWVWIVIAFGNVATAIVGYFWVRHMLKRLDINEAPVHHMEGGSEEVSEAQTKE